MSLLKLSSNYFFFWFISCGRKINCVFFVFWSLLDRNEVIRIDRIGVFVDGKKVGEFVGYYYRCGFGGGSG